MSRTARGRVRLFNKRMMNKTYRELNLVVSYFMWLQIFILFFNIILLYNSSEIHAIAG